MYKIFFSLNFGILYALITAKIKFRDKSVELVKELCYLRSLITITF